MTEGPETTTTEESEEPQQPKVGLTRQEADNLWERTLDH